jgi:hypothetical protein
MEEKIGHAAGQIWEVLSGRKTPVSLTDLPKLTKLKTQLAYQGLGWLAREGKIAYQTSGAKTTVALAAVGCMC